MTDINMEFKTAFESIITQDGIKNLANVRFLYMLDDYSAFKTHPSYRFIFRQLQIDSLIIKILNSPINEAERIINKFILTTGFDKDSVFTLINDIYESVNKISLPTVEVNNGSSKTKYDVPKTVCAHDNKDGSYNLDYAELQKYSPEEREKYVEKIEQFLLSLVRHRTNWEVLLGVDSLRVSIEFKYDYCSCIYFGPIDKKPRCNAIFIRIEFFGSFNNKNSKTEFKAILYNQQGQIMGCNNVILSKSDKKSDYNLIEFAPFYGEKYLDISKISEIRLNSRQI